MRSKIKRIFDKVRLLTRNRREPYSLYDELTGQRIKDKDLYDMAMTHKSANRKNPDGSVRNNERLEYLGDAVIEAVVSEILFVKYPDKDEGFLTSTRSNMVKRDTLNLIARKIGLEKDIKRSDYIGTHSVDFLGNALEALVGAVYMDLGYEAAKQFVNTHIVGQINLDKLVREVNYKSKLIEWSQKNKAEIKFEESEETKDDHSHRFYVRLFVNGKKASEAWGNTKKEAQQNASQYFLKWAEKNERGVRQFM